MINQNRSSLQMGRDDPRSVETDWRIRATPLSRSRGRSYVSRWKWVHTHPTRTFGNRGISPEHGADTLDKIQSPFRGGKGPYSGQRQFASSQ